MYELELLKAQSVHYFNIFLEKSQYTRDLTPGKYLS